MSKQNRSNEQPQEVAETNSVVVEAKPQPVLVYVGSSLPKGTLQQFSVFKNGIPSFLNEHIEKCPAINELMVPISQLNETRENLAVVGSREHTLNELIKKYNGGAK